MAHHAHAPTRYAVNVPSHVPASTRRLAFGMRCQSADSSSATRYEPVGNPKLIPWDRKKPRPAAYDGPCRNARMPIDRPLQPFKSVCTDILTYNYRCAAPKGTTGLPGPLLLFFTICTPLRSPSLSRSFLECRCGTA